MKLATKLGIATVGVALSFAAIGTQSAQAAFINFQGINDDNPDQFDYKILSSTKGDTVLANSVYSLTDLLRVYKVTTGTGFLSSTFTPTSVSLTVKNTVTSAKAQQGFPGLNFSIFSKADAPDVPATTTTSGVGPAVPEPMTVGGSLLAVGFGAWMKRKKAVAA